MDSLSEYIHLDFRSQEPLYLQIVSHMERLVEEKILKPGDQLPTVRQMAIDLRINFSTVARAYHILDEKKLISTQRGRGTYIWEDDIPAEQSTETGSRHIDKADPDHDINRLVHRFIMETRQQGFTLEEINKAFDEEITGYKNK